MSSVSDIVWLHGFPLSSAIFQPQIELEARHVMFDLPGFGTSPLPPAETTSEPTMDDYARIAFEAMDAMDIGQAIFAGFSMGGYIALAAARLAPERVSGLILIDTRETPDDEKARKGRFETIEKVRAQGVQPVVESMLPKMLTPSASDAMREEIRAIMMSSTPEGVIAALRAMANRADSSDLLPRLDIPALVIVGADDTITPPGDAERMANALPQATLVTLANAAHLSNYEQADAFNGAVEAWLSETMNAE